jgi:hypothetical protein
MPFMRRVFLITGISLAFFLGIIACAYAGYLPSPQLPAMNATQATVLGVVEGLTEYLPVSSTGHLIITQHFLGLDQTHAGQKPDDAKKASDAYAICIQAGAILAVLWLYFGRIRRLLGSIVRPDRTNRRLLIGLIIAFIPSAILGLALKDRVIDRLPFRRFEGLNGLAPDPQAECLRYAELLNREEIDLACIGIGENGHLAFNDPPVADFADPYLVKLVDLDPACREQQFREGAFPSIEAVPTQAFTLTIPTILRARTIQCVVPGAVKEIPVWKTLRSPISTACPATILRRHPDTTLYLDSASAALVYPQNNRTETR